MDSKDKKIINSLFDDARMSVAEIEKKTKIRRDSVARRLKKMINEKTILGFSPIINPSSLGYPNISLLLLKTKTGNDSQKEKFLNKLIQTKYIVHISKLIGKYDFYCAILYKDTKHLNEIIEKIKNYWLQSITILFHHTLSRLMHALNP